MYAYYFCNKSRVNLSDKEAAALTSMNLSNGYNEEDKRNGGDLYSNNSVENSVHGLTPFTMNNNSNKYNDNNTPRLKRKRKNSTKIVKKDRKQARHNLRGNNIYDNDEAFINQNLFSNKDDNMDDDDEEEEEEDKVSLFFYLGILYSRLP
jgi:hypothetical protein